MRLEVNFTHEAEVDLEEIALFIARHNPPRAISFKDELIDECLDIANAPQLYPVLKTFPNRNLRKRIHGKYLIFYVVKKTRIDIVRVIHGARDYEILV